MTWMGTIVQEPNINPAYFLSYLECTLSRKRLFIAFVNSLHTAEIKLMYL